MFIFKLSQKFAGIEALALSSSEYDPEKGSYGHVVNLRIPYKARNSSDFPPGCEYELRGSCTRKGVKFLLSKHSRILKCHIVSSNYKNIP